MTVLEWWQKMPTYPFATTKIHSYHLRATKFSWCHWMASEFNHHVTTAIKNLLVTTRGWQLKKIIACGKWKIFNRHSCVATENLSVTKMYFPSPHPLFVFPSSLSPPWWRSKPCRLPSCMILSLKNGYWWEPIGNLNGICWQQMEK